MKMGKLNMTACAVNYLQAESYEEAVEFAHLELLDFEPDVFSNTVPYELLQPEF